MEYTERYRPGPLESIIVDFYRKNDIRSPQDINLEMFAYEANIWIHYASTSSTHYELDGNMFTVVVDDRLPWVFQRAELAHELGHCLLHAGNQSNLSAQMRLFQESQADRFAFYALCPTFMLMNHLVSVNNRQQLLSYLAHQFDVHELWMDVRLKMFEQRMNDLRAQEQMQLALREAAAGYDYSYRHPGNQNIELLVKDGAIVGKRRRAAI